MTEEQNPPGEGGGNEGGDQGDQPGDGGSSLILGRFKTQEDLAKAYTELQSQYTPAAERARRMEQLEAYGISLGEDGQITVPQEWAEAIQAAQGGGKKAEAEQDEEWLDPRAKAAVDALRAEVNELKGVTDSVTFSLAGQERQALVSLVPEKFQEVAGKMFDEGVKSISPAMRRRPDALEALSDAVYGALAKKNREAFSATRGAGAGLAGASERPGGEAPAGTSAPVTEDVRAVYAMMGGKEALGMSVEEYAQAAAEALRGSR